MPKLIPSFSDLPVHSVTVTLDSVTVIIDFVYRSSGWYASMSTPGGVSLIQGRRLSPGVDPFWMCKSLLKPSGSWYVLGVDNYQQTDLGTRLKLLYYSSDELLIIPGLTEIVGNEEETIRDYLEIASVTSLPYSAVSPTSSFESVVRLEERTTFVDAVFTGQHSWYGKTLADIVGATAGNTQDASLPADEIVAGGASPVRFPLLSNPIGGPVQVLYLNSGYSGASTMVFSSGVSFDLPQGDVSIVFRRHPDSASDDGSFMIFMDAELYYVGGAFGLGSIGVTTEISTTEDLHTTPRILSLVREDDVFSVWLDGVRQDQTWWTESPATDAGVATEVGSLDSNFVPEISGIVVSSWDYPVTRSPEHTVFQHMAVLHGALQTIDPRKVF